MTNFDSIAFLFDLDGVLIDSEREYTRIWHEINESFPTGVVDFERKIKGTTLDDILTTYFPSAGIRADVEKLLYEKEQLMRYSYCDGAHDMLERLRDRGIPMALVTSSNDVKMSHIRVQLPELCGYFKSIIDGGMVRHSKPDPEGYLTAAAKLGVCPARCAVVEDSLQGVRAGKAAGAFVIGVAGTLPAETLEPECDLLVDRLHQVDLNAICAILNERHG